MCEARKNTRTVELVKSHYPVATPEIKSNLKCVYNEFLERTGRQRPVHLQQETVKVQGTLTQDDAMKLEVLKRSYFLDYANVDKYLAQRKRLAQGKPVKTEPVKVLSLINTNNTLDDMYAPLSLTTLQNTTPMLDYKNRGRFTESSANKYFDKLAAREDSKRAKAQLLKAE